MKKNSEILVLVYVFLLIISLLVFTAKCQEHPISDTSKGITDGNMYRSQYSKNDEQWAQTDSTILKVIFTCTDYIGNNVVKTIYCSSIKEVGNVYTCIIPGKPKIKLSFGDFKYDISIEEVKKE